MDPVYRIRPWAGGWGVFANGENAAVDPFRTPADAVIHAKELARRARLGAQICVYDESGALLSEFFYQSAERSYSSARVMSREPRSGEGAALEKGSSSSSPAASRPARPRTRRSRSEDDVAHPLQPADTRRGGEESRTMNAAEIMTENPRTMLSTSPLAAAIDALHSLQVRHLPIIDERGHLIGMLSDRDLGPLMKTFIEGAEVDGMAVPPSDRVVADYMTGAVVSVEPEASMAEIIQLMLDERIGAVPVIDDDENVVGIISYVDILRAMISPPEQPAEAQPSA
jgi:acetoin utilization protein AcuB